MKPLTPINFEEGTQAKGSLIAFQFDDKGVPEFLDECGSVRDLLALLAFAQQAIGRRLREVEEGIEAKRRSGQRIVA